MLFLGHISPVNNQRLQSIYHGDSAHAAHGFLQQIQGRNGRPRRAPVRLRLRPEDLQERLKKAWGEWVERQKMLLNEYRLQPWTREAQEFLVEQMNGFFFRRRRRPAQGVRGATTQADVHWCNPAAARPARSGATQVGTWLSLVERTLGVGEVASSNLVVPTNQLTRAGRCRVAKAASSAGNTARQRRSRTPVRCSACCRGRRSP